MKLYTNEIGESYSNADITGQDRYPGWEDDWTVTERELLPGLTEYTDKLGNIIDQEDVLRDYLSPDTDIVVYGIRLHIESIVITDMVTVIVSRI